MTILAKECRVKLKVSNYMDGMRPSFLLILECLPMSDNVRQSAHVYIILIVNLPAE